MTLGDWMEKSVPYIAQMVTVDEEASQIYADYLNYYVTKKMFGEVKTNFENRLIAKAKPIREAEELRLAEEEAREAEIEREKFEKEQRRLKARYGKKASRNDPKRLKTRS